MPTQSGVFHEDYASDFQLRPTTMQRVRIAFVAVLLIALPFLLDPTGMRIANRIMIAIIGAVGLNILTGYTGQISLGQGAFLAIGAYACGLLLVPMAGVEALDFPAIFNWLEAPVRAIAAAQVPWFLALFLAALITAVLGGLFGLPSLRLKGLYLAVATLAAQQIVEWVIINWDPIDGELDGRTTDALNIPATRLFGNEAWQLNNNEYAFYWFVMVIAVIVVIMATNLFRTHIGRAFIAIRDQDIAAEVMGVNIFRYKVLAFAVSSFLVGLAGALTALHSTSISFERFTIEVSIEYLAMIIIGGLGSVSGSVYGAIFVILLPEFIRSTGDASLPIIENMLNALNIEANINNFFITVLPFLQQGAFGLAIVLILVTEPGGIRKIWQNIKDYFRLFPFDY